MGQWNGSLLKNYKYFIINSLAISVGLQFNVLLETSVQSTDVSHNLEGMNVMISFRI